MTYIMPSNFFTEKQTPHKLKEKDLTGFQNNLLQKHIHIGKYNFT